MAKIVHLPWSQNRNFKPQQQYLPPQQTKPSQQTHYQDINSFTHRQTTIPPHQHDIMQLYKAVTNNAQSITLLTNKIDMLFKKFNEHFGKIPNEKKNIANDNINDNKQ